MSDLSIVLEHLQRLDGKIDDIRETVAKARTGIASLDSWREHAHAQAERIEKTTDDMEKRLREQERISARTKVYLALAAAGCSALVAGCVEAAVHHLNR